MYPVITLAIGRDDEPRVWMRFYKGDDRWEIAFRDVEGIPELLADHSLHLLDEPFPISRAWPRPPRDLLQAVFDLTVTTETRVLVNAGPHLTQDNHAMWISVNQGLTELGWSITHILDGVLDYAELVEIIRAYVAPQTVREDGKLRVFASKRANLPTGCIVELLALLGVTSD